MDDVLDRIERANRDRRGGACGEAEAALERQFQCTQRLAVYGTLAPGEANHHLLAGCPGSWTGGGVPGRRSVRRFPVFTYDARAPQVPVQMLSSGGLPAAWAKLDAFEGPDYPRILVPVFAGGHLLAVANLYAAREPVTDGEATAPGRGPSRASPGTT